MSEKMSEAAKVGQTWENATQPTPEQMIVANKKLKGFSPKLTDFTDYRIPNGQTPRNAEEADILFEGGLLTAIPKEDGAPNIQGIEVTEFQRIDQPVDPFGQDPVQAAKADRILKGQEGLEIATVSEAKENPLTSGPRSRNALSPQQVGPQTTAAKVVNKILGLFGK